MTSELRIVRTASMGTEYHIMRGNVVLFSSCYEEAILKKFNEMKGE